MFLLIVAGCFFRAGRIACYQNKEGTKHGNAERRNVRIISSLIPQNLTTTIFHPINFPLFSLFPFFTKEGQYMWTRTNYYEISSQQIHIRNDVMLRTLIYSAEI